jgi:transposase
MRDYNRQNNILNMDEFDLKKFFNEPVSERQRQYEAVRAFVKEELSAKTVAERYAYKVTTIYTLVRNAKAGKLNLFPGIKKGPSQRRTPDATKEKM